MTDESGQMTVSEPSTEEHRGLSTEDFTAEGRRRATDSTRDENAASGGDGPARGGTAEQSDEGTRDDWEGPLFPDSDRERLRGRWETVQQQFVDEPKRAVQDADALVAETIQSLAETFSSARRALEERWSRGDDVDTEELRITLQQYRSFFNRLLDR